MDRAIQMAGDLAERERARLITLDMLAHCRTLPVAGRADAGNRWLHVRLLKEMCDYKDRLTKQVESVMREAKTAFDAQEAKT